jgi:hypothetical protein
MGLKCGNTEVLLHFISHSCPVAWFKCICWSLDTYCCCLDTFGPMNYAHLGCVMYATEHSVKSITHPKCVLASLSVFWKNQAKGRQWKKKCSNTYVLLHLRPTTELTLGLKPRVYTNKLSFAPIRDKLDETKAPKIRGIQRTEWKDPPPSRQKNHLRGRTTRGTSNFCFLVGCWNPLWRVFKTVLFDSTGLFGLFDFDLTLLWLPFWLLWLWIYQCWAGMRKNVRTG